MAAGCGSSPRRGWAAPSTSRCLCYNLSMPPAPTNDLALPCIAGAVVLLGLAALALAMSARYRRLHGIEGKVVYSDTGATTLPARPLYSPRYGLAGKPDYLVSTRGGL